ncbi:MAG: cupin domain-containing protein [Betaproteobacteria bacterium]|nr:cupin domain-containing protein [Betaproteobacteria bacterium]
MKTKAVRPFSGDFRWQDVELLRYKDAGAAPFKDVTRQVLFEDPAIAAQLRYFEVSPGGYSTLERHQHAHAVLILRGRGRVLVGEEVLSVETNDLVSIPGMCWHQFRPAAGEPLGFLCMVNAERDKPQLPGEADLAGLRRDPRIAAFLDGQ